MVDIVLATYNGAANLKQQLDSIINQEYRDWRLFIRDDGSNDGTPEMLKTYAELLSGKIRIIANNGLNLGACQNFAEVLRHAEADHIMFCDQDDIWLPDKIGRTLAKMKEMEACYGAEKPLLVHTDFKVVDAGLKVLASSGWKYQKIDPRKGSSFNRLLVQNVPTGCTMMINKPLRDLALPIPPEAIMHDWWLGLVAVMFGHMGCINEATLLYRQHGGNVTGAVAWGTGHLIRQISGLHQLRGAMQRIRRQAGAFLQRFSPVLSQEHRKMIDIYSRLDNQGFFARRFYLVKYGFWHIGILRNIGMFLIC